MGLQGRHWPLIANILLLRILVLDEIFISFVDAVVSEMWKFWTFETWLIWLTGKSDKAFVENVNL